MLHSSARCASVEYARYFALAAPCDPGASALSMLTSLPGRDTSSVPSYPRRLESASARAATRPTPPKRQVRPSRTKIRRGARRGTKTGQALQRRVGAESTVLHYNEVGARAPHLPASGEFTGSRGRTEGWNFARTGEDGRCGGASGAGFFISPLAGKPARA